MIGLLEKSIIQEYNKSCKLAMGDRYNMKNNFILWFIISAVIMLALPWLAVSFIKGDGGMAVCFILFFAVNPIYSVIILYAGVYLILGIAAMAVSMIIHRKAQR